MFMPNPGWKLSPKGPFWDPRDGMNGFPNGGPMSVFFGTGVFEFGNLGPSPKKFPG